MLQIIGAMTEFERSLIQERVKAALRNTRAKSKKFGSPRAPPDADQVAALRREGAFVVPGMPNSQCEQESAQRSVARLPE
jgi:DNA invertase Pin-like site-specific DNA recombinase